MDLEAVGSGKCDLLRFHELRSGVIGRNDLRCEIFDVAILRKDRGTKRSMFVRMKDGHVLYVAHRRNLNTGSMSDGFRLSPVHRHGPDMSPINVLLVRGIDNVLFVDQPDILNLEVSWGQQTRLSPRDR